MSPMTASAPTIELELETHRRDLTGFCYRMLGSGSEAEDAVQETLVRVWRNAGQLEQRAALRSWLYRIATNVCTDMLQGPQRRARPMDLVSPATADKLIGDTLPEYHWVQPVADSRVLPDYGDPAELASARETIRLAFVAALQLLPPRQRAVLILREVLRWQASEVAELLETSVASVNSALQRARATLDEAGPDPAGPPAVDATQQELLDRYVEAFERYDVDELVSLLHDDAMFSMPPWAFWIQGPAQVHDWLLGQGCGCRGSKVRAIQANGCPAIATFRPAEDGNGYAPFGIAVLEISGDRITGVHNYIEPELFAEFGLPDHLDG